VVHVRRVWALFAVLAAWAVLIGASAVPALAAQPRGTLTAAEYGLLTGAQAKFTAALNKKPIDWNAALVSCRAVGSSTALLRTQREGCLAETQLVDGLASFPGEQTKCGTASPQKYLCLVPIYAALAKAAKAVYSTDVSARQVAVKRGFSGACLDALASPKKITSDERTLATSTETLAKDVKTLAAVAKGQLPASVINISKFQADAKTFEVEAGRVLEYNSPKLSRCPHQ
jgi:hypothetical protein